MADITNPLYGGMFDSTEVVETPGGFPRGNKAVSSDFFAKMISSFYKDGVLHDGGFAVTPAGGMSIDISSGIAWAGGYMAWLQEDLTLTLDTGSNYALLIRLNKAVGSFSLIATELSPSLPTRTANITDLIIAEIRIPSGQSTITSAMITDTRADRNKCGYVTNAVDALGEALHSEDSDRLGNIPASGYVKASGAVMTGALHAAADSTGASMVRNISYGTVVPAHLADGEIFIQLEN